MSPSQSPDSHCPACGRASLEGFFEAPAIPTLACALWPSPEKARACPRGDMRLAFCPGCGYVVNTAFDPAGTDYDTTYENALHFSGVFQEYSRAEARGLVERFDLKGRSVVEIGCGDGRFLSLLCELGAGRGRGYDPSYHPSKNAEPLHPDAEIVTRYFEEADAARERPDLVVSRQVLEHIPQPADLLRSLRRGLEDAPDAVLAIEVPNAEFVLGQVSVWDLIYEHVSLFTAASLSRLFAACGFQVTGTRVGFGGQTLWVEGRPAPPSAADAGPAAGDAEIARTAAMVERFAKEAADKVSRWKEHLGAAAAQGRRVALWGAGAKSVLFLNMVETSDAIGCVVDINPRKHGSSLPGTGHEVRPPSDLAGFGADEVLLMNANYRDEVAASLRDLGASGTLALV